MSWAEPDVAEDVWGEKESVDFFRIENEPEHFYHTNFMVPNKNGLNMRCMQLCCLKIK